ncbi:MAG TPA: TIGR04552 family protein [Polyangiaceae bacterium]|nr:TIGR04552 family protein [Polyangiaceae bacterium]
MSPLKRIGDFSLMDLESVWLILEGSSVIDWRRMHFVDEDSPHAFLASQEFRPDSAADRARLEQIKSAAIDYMRRQFDFPVPRPVERADVLELLRVASGKGHRQLCACAILKAMHIIHHVEARELLFSLALSDQDLFRLIEERVYRLVGHMLSEGLPITEFVGGRKHRDSIYTKLLSKREAHASAIYDKLRFRIVTRSHDDIMPVLLYLSQQLFPFNYVVPGESINTIFHFRSFCRQHPHLANLLNRFQEEVDDEFNLSDNRFSAENYRIIHFVVDLPVRVPDEIMNKAPPHARTLGPIVFGLCEFQILDRETEEANERGEASHANYKNRQRVAVTQRLSLGTRKRPRRSSA